MYDAFFEYIQRLNTAPLTAAEKEKCREAFKPFKLKRKQFFLQEGNHCKYFAFIVKGAMRLYTLDETGAEHVARLGIENWWMGDRESYVMNTPSIYNIDAYENTEMLIITWPNTQELMKIPAFSQMLRKLDDKNNMTNQRRITARISASAEKRYMEFIACYPELLDRFPQYIIAAYRGFAKDTMSRLRSKLLEK